MKTSRYSGQVQVVLEVEIVPACATYKLFNRRRGGLTQLVKDLSQSWYVVRSTISKRGVETKKVLRVRRSGRGAFLACLEIILTR